MSPDPGLCELRLANAEEMAVLASRGTLWAVLDACDEPAVPRKAFDLGEAAAQSLYRGQAQSEKASIAPYLFHVDPVLLDWIDEELAGKPWGIFAVTQADAATLVAHFRSVLMVKSASGEDLYFRFYDPRVLGTYLGQCDARDLRRVFGPVRGYGIAGPGPKEVTFRVSRAGTQPEDASVPLEIKEGQMRAFSARLDGELTARACEKLQGLQGERSDEEYRKKVAGYLDEGRRYGLSWETGLVQFAAASLRLENAREGS